MKKLILLGLLLFSAGNVFAQTDSEAQSILDRVTDTYNTISSFEASFSLNIQNADAGIDENQSGQIAVEGEKYRISTTDINRICDGESVWTHFVEEEEVQINEYDPDDSELSPVRLLNIYKEDFTASLNTYEEQDGYRYAIIDLKPNDISMPYFKVRLFVNQDNNLLTKAVIFEKNSTRYTYSLTDYKRNARFNESTFAFDEAAAEDADIEIIDLR